MYENLGCKKNVVIISKYMNEKKNGVLYFQMQQLTAVHNGAGKGTPGPHLMEDSQHFYRIES